MKTYVLIISRTFPKTHIPIIDGVERGYVTDIPQNDGLSPEDFKEWFKKYDLLEPMAIIHFTKFRY
jgi:hypothetical protein